MSKWHVAAIRHPLHWYWNPMMPLEALVSSIGLAEIVGKPHSGHTRFVYNCADSRYF